MDEQPADMEGSCEYIEKGVAYSRQGVVLQLGLGEALTTSRIKNLTMLRNGYMGLGFERALLNAVMNLRFP